MKLLIQVRNESLYINYQQMENVKTLLFIPMRDGLRVILGLFVLLTIFFIAISPVFGASSPWWENKHGSVRLISADNKIGSETKINLGLQFRMKPGWKIYWRSPGDAGFPPGINWKGSYNLKEAEIRWPAPEKFSVIGLETFGYKDEVILPINILLHNSNQSLKAKAKINYLTCADICIPYETTLELFLPVGTKSTGTEKFLIDDFRALVPKKVTGKNRMIMDALVFGKLGQKSLSISIRNTQNPTLLVEGPRGFVFGKPKIKQNTSNGSKTFNFSILSPIEPEQSGVSSTLLGSKITVTILDTKGSFEETIVIKELKKINFLSQTPKSTLFFLLGLAFLGGLILNLMPCVLPVLSLKLLSVVSQSGAEPKIVRKGFLASAAGIYVSFISLATLVVSLKGAGQTIGWGIQFQQPLFLISMTLLVVIFTANFWGFLEFKLPAFSNLNNTSLKQGILGHFVTGIFVTLLATPCSAPFVGTAVGFALARGPVEIYTIFSVLALGLAFPYLLVSIFPIFVKCLPKPGAWMMTFQRILGVFFLATALWLITVLEKQIGRTPSVITAIILLALLIVLYFRKTATQVIRKIFTASAVVMGIIIFIATARFSEVPNPLVPTTPKNWAVFDPTMIENHLATGKKVFVDVTADWCISCKVNKFLVLDTPVIKKLLNDKDMIAMQADWTQPDPQISAFLKKFMRYGIPFDVVYGSKFPNGKVLPEILTKSSVISAIKNANKKN